MSGFLIVLAVIVGLIALFHVAIFLTSMLETQYLREFVPMTAQNEVAATPYLGAVAAQASVLGYAHGGELRHVKHGLRASTWVTPDRRTIAAIYGGHLLRMPVKKTRLFSRLSNGAVLVTTDETGLPDHTGLQTRQLIMNGSFDELHAAHARWLDAAEAQGTSALPFGATPHAELEAMDAEIARRMEGFGLIRYTDRDAGTFRHTFKGAFANTFAGFFRGVAESSKQAHRQAKPRPG